MSEKIFIGAAWPYANGPLHLGHVAGAYLPADIFARFHRMKGNEVLMVSGSDQHGTPITLLAEKEHTTPAEVVARWHQDFLESWQKMGISFDLFTRTGTDNHAQVVHDIFLKLLEKGYIYTDKMSQPYCPKDQRFLPDRYVEGACPFCKFPIARGDQCDNCGKPMNPAELIGCHCKLCGSTPEFKDSEHFFLKLSAFQDKLTEWAQSQENRWRPNVYNFTMRYLKEGLRDRAITRDIEWGISVPVAGYENKRIYVWFEAVIGYLSASKEWAAARGTPDKWKDFWLDGSKAYYFIGKDNIPFHTLIWPGMLMGYEGLNLPYDVPANEFLTIEGKKLSTSRNWAVWLPDYLSRYDPDPLRYLLSVIMPENGDTDFSWREFVRRNNDELVATYGNLVNRVLTFVYKNFDGAVPAPSAYDAESQALLNKVRDAFKETDKQISACHFKDAIWTAMSLAQESNRYLDAKSPWKVIKQDKAAAATSLYVAIVAISGLRTLFCPFLPFSSQKVHEYLGFKGNVNADGWQLRLPPAGQKLVLPKPLFTKLEDKIADEETARIGKVI
jgi:methionyl-tRNA synthetase